jgi:hypothetical protein
VVEIDTFGYFASCDREHDRTTPIITGLLSEKSGRKSQAQQLIITIL